MAFDAGKTIEALDWNWRPLVDLSGTVPEPTDDELRAMFARLRSSITDVTGQSIDPDDRAAVLKSLAALPDEQQKAINEANLAAIAIVTKSAPSLEQLRAAPPRLQRAFIAWLLGEFANPEGAATATKP